MVIIQLVPPESDRSYTKVRNFKTYSDTFLMNFEYGCIYVINTINLTHSKRSLTLY
jgi:hypothetical protein